ncbi:MAG: hypothetical protein EOO38_24980 [Cytophagaceae bacterium]|nr:MAG: hypothetical protein EOO38_24980 [Cytophagaceae bacterium]
MWNTVTVNGVEYVTLKDAEDAVAAAKQKEFTSKHEPTHPDYGNYGVDPEWAFQNPGWSDEDVRHSRAEATQGTGGAASW